MRKQATRLTSLAMLTAAAYVVMLVTRLSFIPAAPFLEYEAKDVIIAITGFLYGPIEALCSAAAVAALQMFTASMSGPIGFLMNLIAAASFACTASLAYKRRRTIYGAAAALCAGAAALVVAMLLWNYLVTPIYMKIPRETVAKMLVPVFLPFNLVKGALNAAITFFIYKPLSNALHAARLLPPREASGARLLHGGAVDAADVKSMTNAKSAVDVKNTTGANNAADADGAQHVGGVQNAGGAKSGRAQQPARIWLTLGAALVALACVAAIIILRM